MRRLSGIDTAFLYLETPTTHMQVQAVMVLDPSTVPGGYSFEKIKAHLASRLPLLPEFRRRLAFVPFDLHRPVWFDDPDFDLDYHVRHIAVPAPGRPEQLAEIVGDIAGRPLDRARPLWEFWVIEGVENGAVVVVARMHHATIDGVSGSSLLTSILDLEALPVDESADRPRTGSPSTSRRTSSSLEHALISRLRRPLAARARARDAEPAARRDRHHARARDLEPAVGRHAVRHAAHAVERAAHAASAGRVRVGSARRGEGDEERVRLHGQRHRARDRDRRAAPVPRALSTRCRTARCSRRVPVSVRNDETADIDSANKVSAMFVSLPTHLDDVDAQIAHIRDSDAGREGRAPGDRRAHAARARRARRPAQLRPREPAARRARDARHRSRSTS